MNEHEPDHNALDDAAKKVIKICVEEVSVVEEEIPVIDTRWNDLNTILKDKADQLENLENQLQKYQGTMKPLDEKLGELESKTEIETAPLADLDKAKEQEQELRDMLEDFEKMSPALADTIEAGQDILDGNPDVDTAPVQRENEGLKERSENLKNALKEKLEKASALVADLENYSTKEKELEEGIENVNEELEQNKPNKLDLETVKEQLENTKVLWVQILALLRRAYLMSVDTQSVKELSLLNEVLLSRSLFSLWFVLQSIFHANRS